MIQKPYKIVTTHGTNHKEHYWKQEYTLRAPYNKMTRNILFILVCLFSLFFNLVHTDDSLWSAGIPKYPNQRPQGSVATGQAYAPTGNSYGQTYAGTYSNGYAGNGYGSSVPSAQRIGVVLPQTQGYGFMGYDMYSLLGNGFYNMMGYAIPQVYGLQSIPYLHPQALLQPYYNLYGYQSHPYYHPWGHLDVYQMYGYNNPFGGYGSGGLFGYSPMGISQYGLLGLRGNPMFGYKEPGLLERLGFHGVSKDIGNTLLCLIWKSGGFFREA